MNERNDSEGRWQELLTEATACRDSRRFQSLARRARRLADEEGAPSTHTPARIALLGGASTDLLVRPFELALRCVGLTPELHVAPYNVYLQEMFEPRSATVEFAPAVTVLLLTAHNLPVWPEPGADVAAADAAAQAVCDQIFSACRALHERCDTEIVINTLPPLPERPLGNLAARTPSDPDNFIRRVNQRLGDTAPSFVHIHDVAALASRRGLDAWLDLRLWHEAKQPVAPALVPDLVRNAAAVVGALLGRTRKCLVLDLDNTLWGGVIGDDGVEGIELGEGSGVGEAFKLFQSYARRLKERGILLAVCSKNDEAQALRPFEAHPEMVLRRDDFVAFKANWDPKSDNIRAIATQLNIGLDSLVFVDDNPAERAEVRQALPQVLVPEMSSDPSEYPSILDRTHAFEVSGITDEDRKRSEMYRGQEQRAVLESSTRDLTDFLASLEMQAVVRPFEPVSLNRITQLINKTNQFNLTTRRHTPAEVEEMLESQQYFTRTIRLADRFGDHGLISVLFGRMAGDELTIDGWLMSCRVLKRGVERLLLNEVVAGVGPLGVVRIIGEYIPTDRNSMVAGHYSGLGFTQVDAADGDLTRWSLDIGTFEPLDTFISVSE